MAAYIKRKFELAAILGKSQPTINAALTHAGVKKSKRGWHIETCRKAVMASAQSESNLMSGDDEFRRAKLRELEARSEQVELKLAIQRGESIPLSAVRDAIQTIAELQESTFHQRLEIELPGQLEGLTSAAIKKKLVEVSDEIRAIFYNGTKQWNQ